MPYSRFWTCSRNWSTTALSSSPIGGHGGGIRLGAQRIRFAVEFLCKEIELAADRRRLPPAASRADATCVFSRSISSRMSALVARNAASMCSRLSSRPADASISSAHLLGDALADRRRLARRIGLGLQRQRLDARRDGRQAARQRVAFGLRAPASSPASAASSADRIAASRAARTSSLSTDLRHLEHAAQRKQPVGAGRRNAELLLAAAWPARPDPSGRLR